MPRGVAAGRAGVALAALATVAMTASGCGGGSSGKAAASSSSASVSATALTKGASDAIALLAKGRKGTWHAKYTLTAGGGESGAKTTLEVWVRGSEQRQDAVQTVGTTVVSSSETFQLTNSTVTCSKQSGTGPWLCTPSAATNAGSVLGGAGDQLKGIPVTESTDVLQGRAVTCFQAAISGQATRLCVTPDGVPALYVTGQAQLQLSSLDRDVPASVFTPPKNGTS
jgi:hypothetical protein